MIRNLAAAFAFVVLLTAAPVASRAAEPVIYYFGATGCDFCEVGKTFLERWKTDDKRVRLNVYDIVDRGEDALLFVRVTNAIGLIDTVVPMTIIGDHVILGFQDGETTGQEIQGVVQHCREVGCPDVVRLFLEPDNLEAVKAPRNWIIERKYDRTAMRR